MQRVEGFVEVDAPLERVFDRFSDFESFPRWMRNIREVRRTRRGTTRWVSATALPDVYAEWDAEVVVYEPDQRIVWRSVGGDIDADGEAVFSETRVGTTQVRVVLGYDTPLGRSGAQASRFFGVHLGRQLDEDLGHFRRIVEGEGRGRMNYRDDRRRAFAPVAARREASHDLVEGRRPQRPHNERGERRADMTGEPPPRRRELRDGVARVPRRPAYDDARDDYDMRRRDERDGESLGRREREEEEYRPRYALTPRERERARGAQGRRFDPKVAEMFERRGVDRLIDDPPGGRRDNRGRE